MEENMVPNQEPIEEDGFFDDYTEEEIPAEEEVEETPVETPTEQPQEPFLKIRYNKEDVDLDREKTIELSQKGMNYDKVNEKYNALNDDLSKLARMNNLETVEDFMGFLFKVQNENALLNEMDTLKEQYPEAPEELLKELAQKNVDAHNGEIKAREKSQEEQKQKAFEDEAKKQWKTFEEEYPDIDPEQLNPEVFKIIENEGKTLLEAYGKWSRLEAKKNAPTDAQIKINQLNQENKNRSYGNTVNTGDVEDDDFLSGWNEA